MNNSKVNPPFIHSTAEVADDAIIGNDSFLWHNVQVMPGARIGTNCKLGKSVYIDFGVQVGNNVKIQNGISVYKGVTVGDDVLLGPHMVFTNDLYPRAFNDSYEIVPTKVDQGVSVGANATIVCGVTLEKYCMVGAGSVVTANVPPYALVMGNPARVTGCVCSCGKRLNTDNKSKVEMKCDKCGSQFRIEASRLSVI